MQTNEVEKLILSALPEAEVTVSDPMNDGTHLSARIVCASFEGKNRIQRHRMVYAGLGEAFSGPLHALQMTTLTPTEYQE
jgi:acid stress-induced BolA-like protein IbaG/YrbA